MERWGSGSPQTHSLCGQCVLRKPVGTRGISPDCDEQLALELCLEHATGALLASASFGGSGGKCRGGGIAAVLFRAPDVSVRGDQGLVNFWLCACPLAGALPCPLLWPCPLPCAATCPCSFKLSTRAAARSIASAVASAAAVAAACAASSTVTCAGACVACALRSAASGFCRCDCERTGDVRRASDGGRGGNSERACCALLSKAVRFRNDPSWPRRSCDSKSGAISPATGGAWQGGPTWLPIPHPPTPTLLLAPLPPLLLLPALPSQPTSPLPPPPPLQQLLP
eukprot:4466026-Pleurochrysis_carterae.AAC.2